MSTKQIVNGTYMRTYQGQEVSLMGCIESIDSSGNSFSVLATDGILIKVVLSEPLTQHLSGWIEIHGTVRGKDTLICKDYIVTPSDESSEEFDKESHNMLVQFMQNVKQPYALSC